MRALVLIVFVGMISGRSDMPLAVTSKPGTLLVSEVQNPLVGEYVNTAFSIPAVMRITGVDEMGRWGGYQARSAAVERSTGF